MKRIAFFSIIAALMYLPMSGFTYLDEVQENVNPNVRVQQWFITHHKELDARLMELQNDLEKRKASNVILSDYQKARETFKTIEFLFAYIDPQLFQQSINGAPLPKLMKKVPEQIVIEPKGFQRLDELIYCEEINRDVTLKIVRQLRFDINSLSEQSVRYQVSDPVVFEALRFGLLRINTMGITGFDRPGSTKDALRETAISLNGMLDVLQLYQDVTAYQDWDALQTLFLKAQNDLNEGRFESFDRVSFHKKYIDPLWNKLLAFQQSLRIELPTQRFLMLQPVNYTSNSVFADDFLNVNFYAQYADDSRDKERIALGRMLFFDPILSHNNQRACASCHRPDMAYTDGLSTSRSIDGAPGLRNAPTLINSVFAERFFHDLRTDNLAAQMDHVVLNPQEFNTDYLEITRKLNGSEAYKSLFESAYGKEGISKNSVSHAVTRYVASLRSYNSDFDRFMRGESVQIDPAAIRGYNLFSGKAACATCHFAPTFSGLVPPHFLESESEVLGVPRVFESPYEIDPDEGRFMNYILKEQAPFYKYAFKTPTIRNVALTAPYMHNGAFQTLEEVMEFYNKGGGVGLGLNIPHQTLPSDDLGLSETEIQDIIAFMKSLTDTTGMNSAPKELPSFGLNEALNKRPLGGAY
jgi:cytochrome c peroxidase